jgi:hypothetical protein
MTAIAGRLDAALWPRGPDGPCQYLPVARFLLDVHVSLSTELGIGSDAEAAV